MGNRTLGYQKLKQVFKTMSFINLLEVILDILEKKNSIEYHMDLRVNGRNLSAFYARISGPKGGFLPKLPM